MLDQRWIDINIATVSCGFGLFYVNGYIIHRFRRQKKYIYIYIDAVANKYCGISAMCDVTGCVQMAHIIR